MAEGQIEGKGFWVQNNRELEITDFDLAGSSYALNQIIYAFMKPHQKAS